MMTMKLSRKEVEHVAFLSRLALNEREAEEFTRQFNQMFEQFEKLNELDTSQVEPTAHVLQMQNILRQDSVRASLPVDEVLANAPDREDGYFSVPRIME